TTTDSTTSMFSTGAMIASMPREDAATLNGCTKLSIKVADGGLNSIVTRLVFGATSLTNSVHLPPSDGTMGAKPVMLPPGRGRLAINAVPTGSATNTNTTGMVLVACSIAAAAGVELVKRRSGWSATSSLAARFINSTSAAAHRTSIVRLRPTAQPASCKP